MRISGAALPYDRTYHLLARFDKVRLRVRAEGPDVLEAHSPYLGAAAVVACGRRAGSIMTAFWHSDHAGAYLRPAIASRLGAGPAEVATRLARRAIGAFVAPFDATFVAGRAQAQWLRAAGARHVVHVPFGADVATFRPSARDGDLRRELLTGARPGAALLVGAGRFAVEKCWDVVLDAFARVREKRDAVLVLFGDGPERARLERRAPAGVRFHGFERDRRRLAAALASADVLVHGCPYETYGLAVVEAVASGLPVVVPDEGGAAETLDPRCGASYRTLDPEACAAAIETLLARPAGELRAAARDAATRVATAEQHFKTVLAAYHDLLRDSAARRS